MDTTKAIVDLFETINKTPRCSKNEEKIIAWLEEWAKQNGFKTTTDEALNIVIRVPATNGYEHSPTIVLQGHVDMVGEKTPDSKHDFSKDPIRLVHDGEWLRANKTTLGADNGLGIALALHLALDKTLSHPPLELFFTTEEETSLGGANRFDPGMLSGRILINLDTEEEGDFTIGCAGGKDTTIRLPIKTEEFASSDSVYTITIEGLQGGHSGQDIGKIRANANILLARVLHAIWKNHPFHLLSIAGGSAHNAIPRDAQATFSCTCPVFEVLQDTVTSFRKKFTIEYAIAEPNLAISLNRKQVTQPCSVTTVDSSLQIITLMLALPHGVVKMSSIIDNLVETSNNFASIRLHTDEVEIKTNQRSALDSQMSWITERVESVGLLAGSHVSSGNGYSAWQPNIDSILLKRCKETYTKLFQKEPRIKSVHAGLECGIIGTKIPGMDLISLGPTIKHPHSPNECAYIPSINRVYDFLKALLASYTGRGN